MQRPQSTAMAALVALCMSTGADIAAGQPATAASGRTGVWVAVSVPNKTLETFKAEVASLKRCTEETKNSKGADPNAAGPLRRGYTRLFYTCDAPAGEVLGVFGAAADKSIYEKAYVRMSTSVQQSGSCPYIVQCAAGTAKQSSNPWFCRCP